MTDGPKDEKEDRDRLPEDCPEKRSGRKPRSAKVKSKSPESRLGVVERLLRSSVDVVSDGHPRKILAVQAITYKLLQASISGDKKASRALQKFEEFAGQHSVQEFEIVFVDNEYTKALSASRENGDVV